MILSIIVPIYNVEQYLDKCLNSLKHQDLSKEQYEVLLLNDGSTDKSGDKAREYCEDIKLNFHYFEHNNKGLSGTRNRGISEAKGEYIWFIDSDDWIDDNCLVSICEMLKDNIDVLAFSRFIPEGGRIENSNCYNEKVVDKKTLFTEGFTDPAQFYIYRREFLLENNCFFKERIKHEDTLFTPITLHKANNIVFYKKAVYHFLQRPGSITTVVDIKRIYDLRDNIVLLYEYSNNIEDRFVKSGFFNHMAHHITEMLNYGIDNGKEGELLIKEIMSLHPEFWTIMKNAIDMKPKLLYWAVKLSPLPFISTYRLLAKLR